MQSIVTGTFRLDGGAMFGVVPKVLWSKASAADEENRISLVTRTLLMLDPSAGRIILTDTGCGTKWRAEDAKRFAIEHDSHAISRTLQSMGAGEADVTDVIVTHLHFDHNGGITDWADETRRIAVPRYPKARHWIHPIQWEHAHDPNDKDRASYLREDFEAIDKAGLFHMIDNIDRKPFDGIDWFDSTGHTPYQLLPILKHDTGGLIFVGDIIPTALHLRPAWVMAYDLHPLNTMSEKRCFLDLAIREHVLLAFPHDPQIGIASIGGSVDRPVIKEIMES